MFNFIPRQNLTGAFESEYDYDGDSGDETANDAESDDDMVVLGGGGLYEPVKWKYPHKLGCPVTRCGSFGDYLEAKAHFTQKHASQSTLCVPCNKVLQARSLQSHQLTQTHINFVKLTMAAQKNASNQAARTSQPARTAQTTQLVANTAQMAHQSLAVQATKAANEARVAQVVRAFQMVIPTHSDQMKQPNQSAQMAQVTRAIQMAQPPSTIQVEQPRQAARTMATANTVKTVGLFNDFYYFSLEMLGRSHFFRSHSC